MNYTVLPQRKICNKCDHIQSVDEDHCYGCGASFVFVVNDAWKTMPMTSYLTKEDIPCMFDNIKPGIATGLVCNCPKCAAT